MLDFPDSHVSQPHKMHNNSIDKLLMAPTAITATSPHPVIMARSISLASTASGKTPEKTSGIATHSGGGEINNFAAANTKITNKYAKKITLMAEEKERQEATKQEKAGGTHGFGSNFQKEERRCGGKGQG